MSLEIIEALPLLEKDADKSVAMLSVLFSAAAGKDTPDVREHVKWPRCC